MLSRDISGWMKKQAEDAGRDGAVLGLSGGIDSSVTAVLSKMAFRENVLGLILPCRSSGEDEDAAGRFAGIFDVSTMRLDLTGLFDRLMGIVPGDSEIAAANLKPRLRMTVLYYFANTLNYLVVGTGNRSELEAGYFTKYGDGGCDILPLGGLLKTEVRRLAAELGIPDWVINRVPTAGLWEGQTDEGEMGISYEDLDGCLKAIKEGTEETVEKGKLEKTRRLVAKGAHKKAPPPVFIVNG